MFSDRLISRDNYIYVFLDSDLLVERSSYFWCIYYLPAAVVNSHVRTDMTIVLY